MGISSKSREIVKLENAERVSALGKECRNEIDRLKQTMQRGGELQKAVDDAHVRFMSESLDSLTESYLSAYAAEGQIMTPQDIEAIVREMNERVQSLWQSRAELEPRSIGLGFHEQLKELVPRQRPKLILAMRRMERERELARARELPVDSSNEHLNEQAVTSDPTVNSGSGSVAPSSGVTLQDIDILELKPNFFGLGLNINNLIKRVAAWREQRGRKKA